MSVHRRTSDTAIHRGPRRLGGLLRPAPKPRPRHRGDRSESQQSPQPAHA